MKRRFAEELEFYTRGFDLVIGCDEVGRGALAGPVVAAAVAFSDTQKQKKWKLVEDSKHLSEEKRAELSDYIKAHSFWGVGLVEPKVIDENNIHQAVLRAMSQAVNELLKAHGPKNPVLLVDGKFTLPDVKFHQQAIVKGDEFNQSIAAASIVAKHHRDRLMVELGERYPQYNFAKHKGYGTVVHRDAIKESGLSPVHRVSFCDNILNG